jgi:tRNA nucleotidyltransferase (CCA-adding enzyme)
MAYSPARGFADPFGGRNDLAQKLLRAVGNPRQRFTEDALRILRGVRFAVRFGLTPEKETLAAMIELAPRLHNIAAERIFDELCKLLPLVKAEDLLTFAPILCQVIPELVPTVGFDQKNPHHAYDIFTHIAQVVEAVPADLALRWAALLHDVGKPATFTLDEQGQGHFYGHAEESAQMADGILRRLKAPTQLREDVLLLIRQHMTRLEPDKKVIRRWLGRLGKEKLEKLLVLQEADMGRKGTGIPEEMAQFDILRAMIAELLAEDACFSIKDLAVTGRDLQQIGLAPGPDMGRCLNWLLGQVQDEVLPNERDILLRTVKELLEG